MGRGCSVRNTPESADAPRAARAPGASRGGHPPRSGGADGICRWAEGVRYGSPRNPLMRLERHVHRVSDVGFGPRTFLTGGRLELNRDALTDLVLSDDRVAACSVEVAKAGENARVVHICDTVEPQWRARGA